MTSNELEQQINDQFAKYSKRVRRTETGSLNWVDEKAAIMEAIDAHTAAAVREARIDELKTVSSHGFVPEVYLVDRIKTLAQLKSKTSERER